MSDQLINYYRILRQTKKYWKTLFYHLLEISVRNAAVLNKWLCMQAGKKAPTVSDFRDVPVLAIIENFEVAPYNTPQLKNKPVQSRSDMDLHHCWMQEACCCHKQCNRKCPDCQFAPTFCQSTKKDCHERWHSTQFAASQSLVCHVQRKPQQAIAGSAFHGYICTQSSIGQHDRQTDHCNYDTT